MLPLKSRKCRGRLLALSTILAIVALDIVTIEDAVSGQEPAFELPVQLVGFPFIILAVRMSNFVKKLTYSLSPSTYRRNIRSAPDGGILPLSNSERQQQVIDFERVEKDLIAQLGPNVCVFESVCLENVKTAGKKSGDNWIRIIREYSSLPAKKAQFYLLSTFLGDLIKSPELCQHFSKAGRSCGRLPF